MLRHLSVICLSGALALAALAPAQAAEGRKKSMITGVAIGAAGAVAAGMLASKLGQPSAPAPVVEQDAPPPRYTGSVRRVRAEVDEEQSCRMVPTRLYTKDGEYVKTERLEVCR